MQAQAGDHRLVSDFDEFPRDGEAREKFFLTRLSSKYTFI
jgi:hypothetical protein